MTHGRNIHSRSKILSSATAIIFLAGCATITRGTTDTLVITSDPPNAEVTLSNGLRCRTPCSLTVKRDENLVVKIVRDGYEPVEATVAPKVAGAGAAGMAGNVLLGGLIGAAVDAGSGAMYDLVPNPLHVRLVPLDGTAPRKDEVPENGRTEELEASAEPSSGGAAGS